MRSVDPYIDDLDTYTHEAAHAVVAFFYGAKLLRVIGGRRGNTLDGTRGSVEWIGELTPEETAVVYLAGRAAAEGLDVLLDKGTPDERDAKRLGLPAWVEARRHDAWLLIQRRDVSRAVTAVAHALAARDDATISGPEVEQIIRRTMRAG